MEKSIQPKVMPPGTVYTQGRGGQAIIQDPAGNIILTTSNKPGSDLKKVSPSEAISSILISNGENANFIDNSTKYPSKNFITTNFTPTEVTGQVIQAVLSTTTDFNITTTPQTPTPSPTPTPQPPPQPEKTVSVVYPTDDEIFFLEESTVSTYDEPYSHIDIDGTVYLIGNEFIESEGTVDEKNRTSNEKSVANYKNLIYDGSSPNADILRTYLKSKNITENKYSTYKQAELSSGGDIMKNTATAIKFMFDKLLSNPNLKGTKFIVTGGNDFFHQKLYKQGKGFSYHVNGKAIDFAILPATKKTREVINEILGALTINNPTGDLSFVFLDEYANITSKRSGDHFHVSIGSKELNNIRNRWKTNKKWVYVKDYNNKTNWTIK